MIKWFSLVDCQTTLQIIEMVKESKQEDYSYIVSFEASFITPPPHTTKKSRKKCRIIAMKVVLSKINLLNETDSLFTSQKPND